MLQYIMGHKMLIKHSSEFILCFIFLYISEIMKHKIKIAHIDADEDSIHNVFSSHCLYSKSDIMQSMENK